MELIAMLVIIVSILTLLSGLTVFLGSEKFEKKSAFMFLLASIFAAIWSFLTIIFLISQNILNEIHHLFSHNKKQKYLVAILYS